MKTWLLPLVLSSCEAAGMTAHNVAARRASQFEYFGPKTDEFNPDVFYHLAEDRSDAIQAGSPFPDYLYACGDEHDAGEEAHWTPFQIAAVNYIRDTYPDWQTQDRQGDGPGLVAFTMGITSHYIADINWHGLEVIPAGEGLIRTMGYSDFNCTGGSLCSEAHTAADTGGEFVAAASQDLKSWFPERKWFVPTEDLVNIYASLNASGEGPLVEAQWINECAVLFYAGSFGVSRFGDLIYPLLAPKLGGLLLDQFYDFPVGGIDDDAAWTGFMWNRLADWLVYGPPPDDPPPNLRKRPSMLNQIGTRQHHASAKKSYLRAIRRILQQAGDVFAFKTEPTGSVSVGLADDLSNPLLLEQVFERIGKAIIEDYLFVLYPELNPKNEVKYDISNTQSEFGMIERDVKIRAAEMVGAMNHSTTSIEPSDVRIRDRIIKSSGQAKREYFATSLTTMNDGQDLLVGSPGAGVAGGPQEGYVTLQLDIDNESPKVIRFTGGHDIDDVPAHLPSYERFGWSTASCDVNGDNVEDVIICAPSYRGGRNTTAAKGDYTGRCDVFFGPFSTDKNNVHPDLSIYGDKEWGNFGYSVITGDIDSDGHCDLIVSAPFAGSYANIAPDDQGDLSSQGATYIFLSKSFSKFVKTRSIETSRFVAFEAADHILQPPGTYQWFGKSLGIAKTDKGSILIVGAPVFHSEVEGSENSAVGRIYGYKFQALSNKDYDPLFTVTGCSHAALAGHSVASSATHLAFSESGWNATSDNNKILRAGRVHVVDWASFLNKADEQPGHDIPVCELREVISDEKAYSWFDGESVDGRYGSSLMFTPDNCLLSGAPLADDGRGRVYRVDVESGNQELLFSSSDQNIELGKARVGKSFAISGDKILAAAPYATTGAGEQVGVYLEFTNNY